MFLIFSKIKDNTIKKIVYKKINNSNEQLKGSCMHGKVEKLEPRKKIHISHWITKNSSYYI